MTTPDTQLVWYVSDSADETHPDMEVDLAKVGNPGGAEWAHVALEGDGWHWYIYDRWLWDDLQQLAAGTAATLADGKAAIGEWVANQVER